MLKGIARAFLQDLTVTTLALLTDSFFDGDDGDVGSIDVMDLLPSAGVLVVMAENATDHNCAPSLLGPLSNLQTEQEEPGPHQLIPHREDNLMHG